LTFRKFKYSPYGAFISLVHVFQFRWFSLLTYKGEIVLVQGETFLGKVSEVESAQGENWPTLYDYDCDITSRRPELKAPCVHLQSLEVRHSQIRWNCKLSEWFNQPNQHVMSCAHV